MNATRRNNTIGIVRTFHRIALLASLAIAGYYLAHVGGWLCLLLVLGWSGAGWWGAASGVTKGLRDEFHARRARQRSKLAGTVAAVAIVAMILAPAALLGLTNGVLAFLATGWIAMGTIVVAAWQLRRPKKSAIRSEANA